LDPLKRGGRERQEAEEVRVKAKGSKMEEKEWDGRQYSRRSGGGRKRRATEGKRRKGKRKVRVKRGFHSLAYVASIIL
jgi:hypothetical protein